MGSQVKLADAEKTRRLAEGCMGWTYSRADKHHHAAWKTVDGGYLRVDVWQPIHNEAHAAEVRERIIELGFVVHQRHATGYRACTVFKPLALWFDRTDETAIKSLCHAALLAFGLAKEEEL